MNPIPPKDIVHYLVACKIAGLPVAIISADDLRALIARCATLSIPDAVCLLRRGTP